MRSQKDSTSTIQRHVNRAGSVHKIFLRQRQDLDHLEPYRHLCIRIMFRIHLVSIQLNTTQQLGGTSALHHTICDFHVSVMFSVSVFAATLYVDVLVIHLLIVLASPIVSPSTDFWHPPPRSYTFIYIHIHYRSL